MIATESVHRPYNNGTYIQIFEQVNSTLVWQTDCGYSLNCIYTGQTLIFYVHNPMWTPGAHYYILFRSGVATSTDFCGPQSAPVTGIFFIFMSYKNSIFFYVSYHIFHHVLDPTFWTFDILDTGVSTTTTSTITTTTVSTITTQVRSISKNQFIKSIFLLFAQLL